MATPTPDRLYRRPHDRAPIAGVSRGIAHAFSLSPTLVRGDWLLLYALLSAAPEALRAGALGDGPIGWVYLFWLVSGGSPAILL